MRFKKLNPRSFFCSIFIFLFILNLAILIDINFLRQVLGFFFLFFFPGFLIIQLLKLNEIETTEKIVLSVGLSASFLIFWGLFTNELLTALGYKAPLATMPLLISFDIGLLILAIFGFNMNNSYTISVPNLNLTSSEKLFLIGLIVVSMLSIIGIYIINKTNNEIYLIIFFFLMSFYVALISFKNQYFSLRLYPLVIILTSMALISMHMLRFPHIYGNDVHIEYYFFQTTLKNLHWDMLGNSLLNACLSISLLPTIYESVLNTRSQESLFKGIYVLICSFLPLAIYVINKKYIGNLYAFFTSFFFCSQLTFLTTVANPRTVIAIFFMALAIMIFMENRISCIKRRALFIIFISSLIVSHYSTAYIFLFVILMSWIMVELFFRKFSYENSLTFNFIILFYTLIFVWYSQVTDSAFTAGIRFIENTFLSLNQFFVQESRDEVISQLAGNVANPILSRVNLAFTWSTFILIGIGVLTLAIKYKDMIDISDTKAENSDSLRTKIEAEYFAFTLACSGLLVVIVVLPHISTGYSLFRLFLQMIVVLAVCLILGAITVAKYIKIKPDIILLLILIPYFLFQTGAIYHLCGSDNSIIFESNIEKLGREYVSDQDSYGAKWLGIHHDERIGLFADHFGKYRLASQGNYYMYSLDWLSSPEHRKVDGYIYLYYDNIINRNVNVQYGATFNMSDLKDVFSGKNKIYINGYSGVFL